MSIDVDNLKKPPAIVLGLGQNGLASVRSLGRVGIPVIGIDQDLKQFTAHTRYCKKIELSDRKDSQELIDRLVELGEKLPEKGVLFPSGDGPLQRVSENRDILKQYYHFSFPSEDIVKLTLDKKRFYKFAQSHGIIIPDSFFPDSLDECKTIAESISYPCLIKPYQPNLGWRQRFPGEKLFRANDKAELIRLYQELVVVHEDLIVQEIIPGDDSNLSFSLTYFDASSQPLGMFTGRKIRQYPPHFGTSSMAESRHDSFIAEETIRILQALNFTGYGSIEFKWDPRRSVFKAIEITSRTWFPHGISTACGLNLLHIAYCDLLGLPVPEDTGFTEGVRWIHEDRDLRSSLRQLMAKELSLKDWLKSYGGKRTYALAAWDDPGAFYHFMGHLLTVPWRKVKKTVLQRT